MAVAVYISPPVWDWLSRTVCTPVQRIIIRRSRTLGDITGNIVGTEDSSRLSRQLVLDQGACLRMTFGGDPEHPADIRDMFSAAIANARPFLTRVPGLSRCYYQTTHWSANTSEQAARFATPHKALICRCTLISVATTHLLSRLKHQREESSNTVSKTYASQNARIYRPRESA